MSRWMCAAHLCLVPCGSPCPHSSHDCPRAHSSSTPFRGTRPSPMPFLQVSVPCPASARSPLSAAPPAGLDSLLSSFLAANIPLLRHVPKGAASAWGFALAGVISRLATEKSWEALFETLAFPKLTLASPYRGRQSAHALASSVLDRVHAFSSRSPLALAHEALDKARPPKRQKAQQHLSLAEKEARLSGPGFINSLESLMRDGAFSKAVRHILSDGLHDPTDPAVLRSLADKHPTRPPPQPLPEPLPRPFWDDTPEGKAARLKDLKKVIMAFPLASGAGPSGLRP